MQDNTLFLSQSDIAQVLNEVGADVVMDELIERMTDVFIQYNPNETEIRKRSGFDYETPKRGLIEWMPLYQKGSSVLIKIVGYHPDNPAHNMSTIIATTNLYDTSSGHLIASMEASVSTAIRTGAASAIATRLLAIEGLPISLGLVGCGAQAVTQVHAISRVRKIEKIYVYDVEAGASMSLKNRVKFTDIPIEIVDLEKLQESSDVLCTATSINPNAGPVLSGRNVKPWLHVNAVGSDFPGKTELPLGLLQESFVCPDFKEQAAVEGECQKLEDACIGPELHELVKDPKRFLSYRKEKTVFDSTGIALEDKVIFDVLLEHANRLGFGTRLNMGSICSEPKDPYSNLKFKCETMALGA